MNMRSILKLKVHSKTVYCNYHIKGNYTVNVVHLTCSLYKVCVHCC